MKYYVIKVDFYMGDSKGNEWTEPLYLYTDRSRFKVFVFHNELTYLHHDLKWFPTKEEAEEYLKKDTFKNPISFKNPRVEEVSYSY